MPKAMEIFLIRTKIDNLRREQELIRRVLTSQKWSAEEIETANRQMNLNHQEIGELVKKGQDLFT